jgi:peptidoglycan/LPS O-acetylase OafA/YrhL
MQGVLHYPQIVAVFWTLCLEIQFYLVCILLMAFVERVGSQPSGSAFMLRSLAFGTALLSLGMAALEVKSGGWFFEHWYAFALGIVCAIDLNRRAHEALVLGVITLAVGCGLHRMDLVLAGATALSVIVAGRLGRLATTLNSAVVQYLGRTSYSLYLVHCIIIVPPLNFAHRKAPDSLAVSALAVCGAFVMSLVAAYLLYALVEKPSGARAARFTAPRPRPAVAEPGLQVQSAVDPAPPS